MGMAYPAGWIVEFISFGRNEEVAYQACDWHRYPSPCFYGIAVGLILILAINRAIYNLDSCLRGTRLELAANSISIDSTVLVLLGLEISSFRFNRSLTYSS